MYACADDFDYGSDGMEASSDNEESNSFMGSYSDALNEELKTTTLNKSFIRANEQMVKTGEVSYVSVYYFRMSFFFSFDIGKIRLSALPNYIVSGL